MRASPQRSTRNAFAMSLMTMLLVLVASCGESTSREPQPMTYENPVLQELADSPCDTEKFATLARTQLDTSTIVSGSSIDKSETHDCQRLLVGTGDEYGPLVGLLISMNKVAQTNFALGDVVGEIVNYSDSIAPMNIAPGINCLWIQGELDTWTAEIRRIRPHGNCESGPFEPGVQTLDVTRRIHSGPDETRYPSTARWMWDRVGLEHYIGVRCGNGWCEMGVGFEGTKEPFLNSDSVPGWYDEQILSYTQSPNDLRPSRLLGRIAPVPGLDRLGPEYFQGDDGNVVATITLETLGGATGDMLAAYRQKFRIPGSGMSNELRLRNLGSPQFSGGVGTDRNWKPAVYNKHTVHAPTGAVRWAWSEQDEDGWTPCEAGCCRTDGCLACPPT